MVENKSGVYSIKNRENGKVYIGSAVNIAARWAIHRSELQNNKHHSRYLQNAYNKYGADNFVFALIKECKKEVLIVEEQHYIDKFKSADSEYGYNMCPLAKNTLGYVFSTEQKRRLSKSLRGVKPKNKGKRSTRKGTPLAEEHKRKIALSNQKATEIPPLSKEEKIQLYKDYTQSFLTVKELTSKYNKSRKTIITTLAKVRDGEDLSTYPRRKYDDETVGTILELYKTVGSRKISKMLNIPRSSVRQIISKNQASAPMRTSSKYNEKIIEEIFNLKNQGLGSRRIAKRLGIPRSSITAIITRSQI